MNKYNLAGMLKTYSEKCSKAETDAQLKKIVCDLKADLRVAEKEAQNEC